MDDAFALPVSYGGKELEFPLRIMAQGFVVRYLVEVDGWELTYEQDDAGDLRAIAQQEAAASSDKPPDPGLLGAIGAVLQQLRG